MVDLFGWGTGDNPIRLGEDHTFNNFVDWGSNTISNSNNTGWRTLSLPEWEYLLDYRPGAARKRGMARVRDISGVVLLPDNWTAPSGVPVFSPTGDNIYTTVQWAAMENNGAIFLPFAGWSQNKPFASGAITRTVERVDDCGFSGPQPRACLRVTKYPGPTA